MSSSRALESLQAYLDGIGEDNSSGLTDAPIAVLMDMQYEKIELLLNRFVLRLEASFEAKFHALSPAAVPDAHQFQEPNTQVASLGPHGKVDFYPAGAGVGDKDVLRQSSSTNDGGWQLDSSDLEETEETAKPQGVAGVFYEDNKRLFNHLKQALGDGEAHKHTRLFKDLHGMKGGVRGFWHEIFAYMGFSSWLPVEMPQTPMAKFTECREYKSFTSGLILTSTCLMCYEADSTIKSVLSDQAADGHQIVTTINSVFNYIFLLDLLFNVVALRAWYFVSPDSWGWNWGDMLVVVSSIISDWMGEGNLTFLRSFRILRAVRSARIIRVLRFFRELRKILLAIMACLKSLFWCFLFLICTMFTVSILLLQGLADGLSDLPASEYVDAASAVSGWYGSMPRAMFSILAGFTGGTDWYSAYAPLHYAGKIYQGAFVAYILFVIVGIMNVLTGVFLSSANDILDHDLVIQDYKLSVQTFVTMMLDLFEELDLERTGDVDWPTFKKAIDHDSVQAYLSSNGLEPMHAHLIFDLLDESRSGKVNLFQFVMGMVNLKGVATAIDARVIMRQIGLIPELIKSIR